MTTSIYLNYLKGIIPEYELDELSHNFSSVGIEFDYFDISEEPQASAEEILSPILFFLSSDIVQAYILGLLTSTSYDLIKKSILSIWRHISGETIRVTTASGIQKIKEASLDLDISLNDRTKVKFKLKGDISEKIKEKCIDNAFQLLKSADSFKTKGLYIALYDIDQDSWDIYKDVEFIRKFILKERDQACS